MIEDLIQKEELDKYMNQRYYAGYSLAPQIKAKIAKSLEDEYSMSVEELDQMLTDAKFSKKVNLAYKVRY